MGPALEPQISRYVDASLSLRVRDWSSRGCFAPRSVPAEVRTPCGSRAASPPVSQKMSNVKDFTINFLAGGISGA